MAEQTHPVIYTSLDLFRFVACILVVVIHTHPLAGCCADYYLTSFCRIAVPFFFCTSAFLFWKNNPDIKKYIRRMAILYCVWFIIELPYVYFRFFTTDHSLPVQFAIFIKQLLFSNTFGASWYITASVQAVVIVWWLSSRVKEKTMITIASMLYLFCCLSSLYYGLIDGTVVGSFIHYFSYLMIPANSFIVAVIYIVLGRHIALNPKEYNSKWCLYLVASFVFGFVELFICKDTYRINDAFISLVPITYFVMRILSSKHISISNKLCHFFRANSSLVYFIHAYLLFWTLSILKMTQGASLFLIVLVISLILSSILYLCSKRIRIFRFLY